MHNTLAMSSTEHNLWTLANILGLVVVVAVAALLSLLIYLVKVIDRRVVAVRDTLNEAAANTADTVLIPQVAAGVEAVLAEGLQHHLFLGRVLGKVKIMTGLVVWTVIDVLLLIAGPGVLPVLGGYPAHPDRREPGGVRRDRAAPSWATPSSSGPGWSTSTRPAAWWRGAAAAVRDGRGHRDRRHAQAGAARGARAGPARLGHAPLAPARRGRLPRRPVASRA